MNGRGLTRPWAARIGRRAYGEPAYLDLRCVSCKWGVRLNGAHPANRSKV